MVQFSLHLHYGCIQVLYLYLIFFQHCGLLADTIPQSVNPSIL